MFSEIDAIVVREVEYKETDKILTVISRQEGCLTVSARGARKQGSPHAAASQLLSRSSMVLSEYRQRLTLREADLTESFPALRGDLEKMALAAYIAEVAAALMPEGQPSPELFELTLSALQALAGSKRDPLIVKGAFELAAMCLAGYAPDLGKCAVCGKETGTMALDLAGGRVSCLECADGAGAAITSGVLDALRFVSGRAAAKPFSFTLSTADTALFSRVCERYLLAQTDKLFYQLDFYKGLTGRI